MVTNKIENKLILIFDKHFKVYYQKSHFKRINKESVGIWRFASSCECVQLGLKKKERTNKVNPTEKEQSKGSKQHFEKELQLFLKKSEGGTRLKNLLEENKGIQGRGIKVSPL